MSGVSSDLIYLQQALIEAKKGVGFCAPNPPVGAVVVKNQRIIAKGAHMKAGSAHAEAIALQCLNDEQAAGATLYVTLEPCNHYGRTPPCTELIIQKKITRVVYAMKDPNPKVVGCGHDRLHQAGIVCEQIDDFAINQFYQSYVWYCLHQRPFVTAKLALSVNGKIAEQNGLRTTITGPQFQKWVHEQRLVADALLTTAKTIIQDDPYLNVRLQQSTLLKPLYILDRQLRTPLTAKIVQTGAACCFFYEPNAVSSHRLDQFLQQGIRCIAVSSAFDQLDLARVLEVIGKEGVHNLWIEAGGKCFQSFVTAGLLNKAYLAIGLKWLSPLAQAAFESDIFTTVKTHQWFIIGNEPVCMMEW